MPMKAWLIRILQFRTAQTENVIERVINHQFESALSAMEQHASLELTGFGKYYFNKRKALKKMEKMLSQKSVFEKMSVNPDLSEARRRSAEYKLKNIVQNIEALKPKLHED